MRRVIVQPEVRARNLLEHGPPNGRTDGKIAAPGPFVDRKQHGTILDADANVFNLGMANDVSPNLLKQRPIPFNWLDRIAADERIDNAHIQKRRGADDTFQMV